MLLNDGNEVDLIGSDVAIEMLEVGDLFIAGERGTCLLAYLGQCTFLACESWHRYLVDAGTPVVRVNRKSPPAWPNRAPDPALRIWHRQHFTPRAAQLSFDQGAGI